MKIIKYAFICIYIVVCAILLFLIVNQFSGVMQVITIPQTQSFKPKKPNTGTMQGRIFCKDPFKQVVSFFVAQHKHPSVYAGTTCYIVSEKLKDGSQIFRYKFIGLKPHISYEIYFSNGKYVFYYKNVRVQPGQVKFLDVRLEKQGAQVKGRVLTKNGKPASKVKVKLKCGNSRSILIPDNTMTTDEDGRFLIKGLPPANYQIIFKDRGLQSVSVSIPEDALGKVIDLGTILLKCEVDSK